MRRKYLISLIIIIISIAAFSCYFGILGNGGDGNNKKDNPIQISKDEIISINKISQNVVIKELDPKKINDERIKKVLLKTMQDGEKNTIRIDEDDFVLINEVNKEYKEIGFKLENRKLIVNCITNNNISLEQPKQYLFFIDDVKKSSYDTIEYITNGEFIK